jgi:hypothetical protein
MDAFDRLEPIARPLLSQVDSVLARWGAAPTHPVWALIRVVGASPGQAVRFFASLDSSTLDAAGAGLRAQAVHYGELGLPVEVAWRGSAGAAFGQRLSALRSHLGDDSDASLTGRLTATASLLDALVQWQLRSRLRMARHLAEIIGCGEAVALRASGGPGLAATESSTAATTAAANLGAHVLAAAAHALAEGQDLPGQWRPAVAELSWADPAASVHRLDKIEIPR